VDYIRLRDKEQPGEPLHSRMIGLAPGEYADDKNIPADAKCRNYKLETTHFLREPEKKFPGVFEIITLRHKWYKCSDKDNTWSNNIFIAKTEFLRGRVQKLLEDRGMADRTDSNLEDFLMQNLKGYTLASGPGLFKHNRLDR
jgi:hypothetical protein